MAEYKLSASLEGHEDDVRDVVFPSPQAIVSASRDATVRIWKLLSSSPPEYDCSISSHGSAFINALTFVPPTKEYPEGLIVSGGKDTVIEVREPGKPPSQDAERLLLGHAHNVCALDFSVEGGFVVSGSWDNTARVWNIGKWECEALLDEHGLSVWDVLAYDKGTIITACADKIIRIFTPDGKLLRAIKGNTDVVRALCRIAPGHPSRADFASAGNDGVIRLWQLNGRQVGELHGHESFIYSLASTPSGELISSGEDRTVRVWRNNECVQTITHPAISVWAVAVCSENGDIVSGASDRIVRIFTRSPERQASAQVIQAFEDSVKSSAIPQQQVSEINKEQLPGPEFLTQKSGTKEGQIAMIKEANGSIIAYSWSTAAQKWVQVGTVVDSVGSSGKKQSYHGQDYDYVFDVDIEDGKPPLKLPYNLSQNPFEAATKFIGDNELSMNYLNQVADFIVKNTQGATIGQSQQPLQASPSGADPWGMESRYRPGDANQTPSSRPKILPQRHYLSIKTANLTAIQKKIEELNSKLIASGEKNAALNPEQMSVLQSLTSCLERDPPAAATSSSAIGNGFGLVIHLATTWPPSHRLPALDLLRLITAASVDAAVYRTSNNDSLVEVLASSGAFADHDRPNNTMLSVRALANLFETEKGRQLADNKFDKIHDLVRGSINVIANRNLVIAVTTLYINYAVLCTSASYKDLPSSIDRGLALLDDLTKILGHEKDSEAIYRALVAVGTFLALGEEVQAAAKELYGVESALATAEKGVKEPRIKAVVGEIRNVLGI